MNPDPDATERVAVLSGERGGEAQIAAMTALAFQRIEQAFSLVRIVTAGDVISLPGENPLIYTP